jgi:hypothetical protein
LIFQDRSLEEKIDSAEKASIVHEKLTGHPLYVTPELVELNKKYPEVGDIDIEGDNAFDDEEEEYEDIREMGVEIGKGVEREREHLRNQERAFVASSHRRVSPPV